MQAIAVIMVWTTRRTTASRHEGRLLAQTGRRYTGCTCAAGSKEGADHDAAGASLANRTVSITRSDGRSALQVDTPTDGVVVVTVEPAAAEPAPTRWRIETVDGRAVLGAIADVDPVAPGSEPLRRGITLEPLPDLVAGRVLAADDTPVPGVNVRLLPDESQRGRPTTPIATATARTPPKDSRPTRGRSRA